MQKINDEKGREQRSKDIHSVCVHKRPETYNIVKCQWQSIQTRGLAKQELKGYLCAKKFVSSERRLMSNQCDEILPPQHSQRQSSQKAKIFFAVALPSIEIIVATKGSLYQRCRMPVKICLLGSANGGSGWWV